MAIKLGTAVQQIVTPIIGVVVKKQFDETSDKFQFLVETKDSEGQVHSRWFDEDQLEETK
jgi:hypothetical protein